MSSPLFGALVSLAVTVFIVRLLLKHFRSQFVLFFGGIILLLTAILMGHPEAILPAKQTTTGFWGFDIFKAISSIFSSRLAGLGLIIMAASGYAKYMDIIGASSYMARVMTSPLQHLKAPYVVVGASYAIGQFINIFVPSASGLAMLMMVTVFPVLMRLGVSRLTAASLVATTGCLDLGPGSGNSVLAAQNSGMDIITYFASYQVPTAIVVVAVIAVLHWAAQQYFDKKEQFVFNEAELDAEEQKATAETPVPKYYFFLPLLPLVLLLVFSRFAISTIKLNVPTVMFFSLCVAMTCECIRNRNHIKSVFDKAIGFFDVMGSQCARVISLIVAGETFALGLKATGTVDLLIQSAQGMGFGPIGMMVFMTLLISVSAVVMGSGNAPFFAFAALAPGIAKDMGFNAVLLLLPMQLASGIARTVSPITGVIVAVAGLSGCSPFDIVRRTAIPMAGGLITTIIMGIILA